MPSADLLLGKVSTAVRGLFPPEGGHLPPAKRPRLKARLRPHSSQYQLFGLAILENHFLQEVLLS